MLNFETITNLIKLKWTFFYIFGQQFLKDA